MLMSRSGEKAFGDLIQLVGGIFSFLLGFILPPLFHIRIMHKEKRLSALSFIFHGIIFLLGAVLLTSSTYFTILDLITPTGNATAPNSTHHNGTLPYSTLPNATLFTHVD